MADMVKRDLRLTSPHTRGEDVKRLQRALNQRAAARRLTRVTVDGEYGPATAGLYRKVGWALGLLESTLDHGATEGAQRIVIDPDTRTREQLARAKARQAADHGREGAIKWALAQVGTMEHPAGSNGGPGISTWQDTFKMGRGPWCGAFAGYALLKAGGVPVTSRVVYCPSIEADARNGVAGFERFVSLKDAQRGDLPLFDFSTPVTFPQHVGLLLDKTASGLLETVEGNTSAGPGGSQDNGGMVAHRHDRSNRFVVGYARPRWT